MEQNFFQLYQQYFKQTDELAMDAPTSSVLAETYVQHMEQNWIYPILIKQQIIAYFRYVNDMIYAQNKGNIEHTLNEFNNINHP
jgi:hypothetical protein